MDLRHYLYISEEARRALDRLAVLGVEGIAEAVGIDPSRVTTTIQVHDEVMVDLRGASPDEVRRFADAYFAKLAEGLPVTLGGH